MEAMKEKVLNEIIDLMDQLDAQGLKKKPVDAMAISVDAKPGDEQLGDDDDKFGKEEPDEGSPLEEKQDEEELDPEMLKKLLEEMG